jgi:hypothetical protein
MAQMPDNLQQQAENIVQAIRTAFLDMSLPPATRLGCGYWMRHADGEVEYIYQGDALHIEAFFRGVEFWDIVGKTPTETDIIVRRFFLAPPPAKRWTEVVGVPLLSWRWVTSSRFYMAPRARAYYLPAYVLTALSFLVVFPSAPYGAPQGHVCPLEFVGDTLDMLLPPSDAIGWGDLAHLPPEGFGPSQQSLEVGRAEDFLRYIQWLTTLQKRAIQRFVAFALRTYPLYVPPICVYQDKVATLTRFWLQPTFAW